MKIRLLLSLRLRLAALGATSTKLVGAGRVSFSVVYPSSCVTCLEAELTLQIALIIIDFVLRRFILEATITTSVLL
jgi:hypothetical protein